jgi:hypothetical protein
VTGDRISYARLSQLIGGRELETLTPATKPAA